MIGETTSHCTILEEPASSGMGMVCNTEDRKLKSIVALKFLPPELIRDTNAKTRFIHEAQAASVLQHRSICTIREISETGGGYIVIAKNCYSSVFREK